MKILMLGWELPPYHTGGLGVACYQMCKQLAAKGLEIEFVLPLKANYDIDFMKVTTTDMEISNLSSSISAPSYGGNYSSADFQYGNLNGQQISYLQLQEDNFVKFVARLAKKKNFDVIHAHDWLTIRAALIAKMISHKPLILHIHATEFDRSGGGYGNPMVREIELQGMLMADKIFAVSQNTKDIIVREYGIAPKKIAVVHNALDINPKDMQETGNVFHYIEQMKRHGYKVVLNAGRITIQKGLAQLISAAKKVLEQEPKTLFLFVGGGEQLQEMVQKSADLQIAHKLIFTGFVNGTTKEWRDAFRVADIFVMPSVNEPFGIAALEAVAYGHSPILLSKQSGVGEVLTRALKVDFWDVEKMADQIINVLRNSSLQATLGEDCHKQAGGISWSESAEKIIGTYHELTGAI